MRTVYQLFERIRNDPLLSLSASGLHPLRDYFFGYMAAIDKASRASSLGEPPFTQFGHWLARRFGEVVPGPIYCMTGMWPRTSSSCWSLLEGQFGAGEEGFRKFFELLDEFRQREPVLMATSECANLPDAPEAGGWAARHGASALKAVRYLPDEGVYLYAVRPGREDEECGYFGSLAHAINYAQAWCGVAQHRWTIAQPNACEGSGRDRGDQRLRKLLDRMRVSGDAANS